MACVPWGQGGGRPLAPGEEQSLREPLGTSPPGRVTGLVLCSGWTKLLDGLVPNACSSLRRVWSQLVSPALLTGCCGADHPKPGPQMAPPLCLPWEWSLCPWTPRPEAQDHQSSLLSTSGCQHVGSKLRSGPSPVCGPGLGTGSPQCCRLPRAWRLPSQAWADPPVLRLPACAASPPSWQPRCSVVSRSPWATSRRKAAGGPTPGRWRPSKPWAPGTV